MEKEKFLKECGITQKDVDEAKCTVEELKKCITISRGNVLNMKL